MLRTPDVDGLTDAVAALRSWQYDGAPMQLHPGDVGWFWQVGAEATAAALRIWRRDGRILAVGLLDGPTLLRLTTAPEAVRDEALARQLAADLTDPERGVLPAGKVAIEARRGALVQDRLLEHGWQEDEPWSPLRRDLTEPVPDAGLRIEAIGPDRAHERIAVQRAAFDGSKFSAERWQAMAAGPPYQDARCLVGYDDQGDAVAMTTGVVGRPGQARLDRAAGRASGPSRPRLRHRDHRRRRRSPPRARLDQRDGLHAERECRRGRHLPSRGLPAPPRDPGPEPGRLTRLVTAGHRNRFLESVTWVLL